MEAVFLKILNMSLTASLLVAVVLLLRLLLMRAPKWIRGILWAMVALRLLLPFSFESALSLLPSAEPIPPEILSPVSDGSVNADTLPELPNAPDIDNKPLEPAPSLNETVNSVLIETMPPQIAETENPVLTLTQIFSVVWLVGIGLMLVYTLVSYLRIRLRVSESLDLDDGIFLCDRIVTPFIIGIIRPRIYLPSTMADSDIPYVLAHERAHLRRLDYLWKPLGFLILSVYWFNPVIWVAYILFCRDIELACDEKVVAKLGTKIKKPYSEALINCSVPRKMISACPLAFGESSIKGRIKSVLNYKKPALWIIIAALVLCTAAGVFFLTNPQEQAEHNANGGSDLDGLSLEFISFTNDPDVPTPVLEIRWNNQSDEDITFGAAYTLYRYEGDELVDCRDTEPIWHLVGYLLRAHTFNTREYGLFDIDLSKPGRYRFESEFTLDKDSGTANRKEYVAWVEFELGEEDIVVTEDQSSEEESSQPEPTGDFDIDEPIVLARSNVKFIDGSIFYYLTLEMVDGRFYKGGEGDIYNNNYEGTAELRLYDIETDELIDRKQVQFYEDTPMLFSGEFQFKFAEYNSDYSPDFSIGQYYDSHHYVYRLYSVSSAGSINEITVEPEPLLATTDGFSEKFDFSNPWMYIPVYDEERGEFTYFYRFDIFNNDYYKLEFIKQSFGGKPTYFIKEGKLVTQEFYNSLSLPRETVYATESDLEAWEELLYSGKIASLGFAESYTYEASDVYIPEEVPIPVVTANVIWGSLQQTPLDIYSEHEDIATGGGANYIFGYDENGEILFYIEDGGHFTITYPGENKRLIFNAKAADLHWWSDIAQFVPDSYSPVLALPQGQLIQNGKNIIWEANNGTKKLLVSAEEGNEGNQAFVHSISPDSKSIYYIKSVVPGSSNYLGGFIDLETLNVHPLDTPVYYSGIKNDESDCKWSNSLKYVVVRSDSGHLLINTSDFQTLLTAPPGTLSPDETKIAYWKTYENSKREDLHVIDIASGDDTFVTSVTHKAPNYGSFRAPLGPFWKGNDTILFNVHTSFGVNTINTDVYAANIYTNEVTEGISYFSENAPFKSNPNTIYAISSDSRYILLGIGHLAVYDSLTNRIYDSDLFQQYEVSDVIFYWDSSVNAFKNYYAFKFDEDVFQPVYVTVDGRVFDAVEMALYSTTPSNRVQSLSEAEISALREQYPICGNIPPHIDLVTPSFEQIIKDAVRMRGRDGQTIYENAGNFVYGEIVSSAQNSSSYVYTIKVKDDVRNRFAKNSVVTFYYSKNLGDYNPTFTDGMEVVLPLFSSDDPNRNYDTILTGTYYVTEDGYVLSAFNETSYSNQKFSGLKVGVLMDHLTKVIKKTETAVAELQ